MKSFFLQDPKLLLYGFLIIFFASYGQTFFISLFNENIREYYSLTDGEFGLIYAVATTLSSLALVSFAKLIDYIDLRIYSLLVSFGLSVACFGMFIFFYNIIFLFIIIFDIRFFGQGAMTHSGETTMARYFGENRGKAISFSTFGGMIGVMLLPIIVVKLSKFVGYQNVWLIAFVSLLIFIPFLFFILNNQRSRHKNFSKNNFSNTINKKLRTRDVLLDKKFYYYLPISISTPFISTGLMFHQIFIINQKGWTIEMLGNSYIFYGFFSILGLLIGGPLIDKFNTRKTALTCLIPLLVAILVLLFFEKFIFLFIYMSFYVFSQGISSPFIGALWAELYGVESLGTVKALLHASMVLASALSPLIFGYLIDWGLGISTIVLISFFVIVFSTILPIFNKND